MDLLTIDGTSARKIQFDTVTWLDTKEVRDYCQHNISTNTVLETFRRMPQLPFVGLSIRFDDDIWDFAQYGDAKNNRQMTFHFESNSLYKDYEKLFVLNNIFKRSMKIRVLHDKYLVIHQVLSALETMGYSDFQFVPKAAFEKYYEGLAQKVSYNTLVKQKRMMKSFVEFYTRNVVELSDTGIMKYLSDADVSRMKINQEANKTPEIPPEYLAILIPAYQQIMHDVSEKSDDRIMAAALLLCSQTGLRTGELLTIDVDSVTEELGIKNQAPLRYLSYSSFKHGIGDTGYTTGRTFINDIAYDAYKHLKDLCQPKRNKIGTNALIVFRQQRNKYFAVAKFSKKYHLFVLRHAKILQCINIGEQYNEAMITEHVSRYFSATDSKGKKYLDTNKDCYDGFTNEDTITYPAIRQFRVSVCTYLYRQQVPLHYIRKHMNHLTADMTAYYIRPEQNAERNYSETIYSAVFKDKAKVLGQHGDVFIEKINAYIESMEPDIKDDVDAVIAAVADKYPLRSKVGGFCIRCGNVVPCASNNDTDTIFCAFGMCPNHCHMFFMADISYKAFQDVRVALQYNEEHGYKKAVQKERNKLDYILQNSLVPEITELDRAIERDGAKEIATKYPQLIEIIENLDAIHEEIEQWA